MVMEGKSHDVIRVQVKAKGAAAVPYGAIGAMRNAGYMHTSEPALAPKYEA